MATSDFLAEVFDTGDLDLPAVSKLERLHRPLDDRHKVWLADSGYHIRIARPGKEDALIHDHQIRRSLPLDLPHQKTALGATTRGEVIVVQQHIEGPTVASLLAAATTAEEVTTVVTDAVDYMKRLHAVTPTDEWRHPPNNWVTRLHAKNTITPMGLELELLIAHKLIDPKMANLLPARVAYLMGQSGLRNFGVRDPSIKPISLRQGPIHADFHCENLFVAAETGTMTGSDFEKAMIGWRIFDGYQFLRGLMMSTDLIAVDDIADSLRYLMDPPAATALAIEALDIQRIVSSAAEFIREHPEYSDRALADRYKSLNEKLEFRLREGSDYRHLAAQLMIVDGLEPPEELFRIPTASEGSMSLRIYLQQAVADAGTGLEFLARPTQP